MEAIKKIVKIPKSHEITIKIPQHIPENEIAEVILFININSNNSKIDELKDAMKDTLFMNDLREISEDFKVVDVEGWE